MEFTGGMGQVVQCMPGKCKALNSNPSTTKNKNEKKIHGIPSKSPGSFLIHPFYAHTIFHTVSVQQSILGPSITNNQFGNHLHLYFCLCL
jgi:hypothetical protein